MELFAFRKNVEWNFINKNIIDFNYARSLKIGDLPRDLLHELPICSLQQMALTTKVLWFKSSLNVRELPPSWAYKEKWVFDRCGIQICMIIANGATWGNIHILSAVSYL